MRNSRSDAYCARHTQYCRLDLKLVQSQYRAPVFAQVRGSFGGLHHSIACHLPLVPLPLSDDTDAPDTDAPDTAGIWGMVLRSGA